MHVKICGLTNLADARTALRAGADLLGFNFYRPSPRYVEPAAAAQIIATLRAESGGTRPQAASTPVGRSGSPLPGVYAYRCVGVLVNMPLVEALALGVTANRSVWRTLQQLSATRPGLEGDWRNMHTRAAVAWGSGPRPRWPPRPPSPGSRRGRRR